MGEIRADDKEVFFIEIRLQDLGHLLKDIQTLGANHDRHYRRDVLKNHLQEGQLNLQTVLPIVCIGAGSEGSLSLFDKLYPSGHIDGDLSQGRFGGGIQGVHAGRIESYPVAWPKQENAFITMPAGNLVKGRCRHFSAENVSCMGHDKGLWSFLAGGMHPGAQQGFDFLGGCGIERSCDGGFSYFLFIRVRHSGRVNGKKKNDSDMKEYEHRLYYGIDHPKEIRSEGVEVAGRGVLHLSVLMETMRREGFEFQVGRPRVLFKKENGVQLEPIEQAVVECPGEYAGKVIEVFGNAGGTMVEMVAGETQTHLEFRIPTRGVMGLKNRILNVTHGEAVFYHTFLEYGPFAGDIGGRQNGAMISMTTEAAVAYALGTLQERGSLFVGPGDACYEGMLVGERPQSGDMVVNVAKTKNLGNQRSSTADIAVQLTPPRTFSLEEALEYIMDDELVEITPKHIRMRKRLLTETERRKWNVRHGLVNK